MPDTSDPKPDDVLVPSVVPSAVDAAGEADDGANVESVQEPGKVMRIGSMIKQLLEEVRAADLDEPSRERLREIYDTSRAELASALSPDLQAELARLTHPFEGTAAPTGSELRVAKAQLVGWLEGLFHGIQATLFAQQMAARQQLEQMQRQLPQGQGPQADSGPVGGTYL